MAVTVLTWKDWLASALHLLRHPRRDIVGMRQKIYVGLMLLWEKSAAHFWPVFLAFAVFTAAALFDLPQSLPGWLHSLLLAFLALYALHAVVRLAHHLSWPERSAILRRIEIASDLQHRPLTALEDHMAGDPTRHGKTWWYKHQQRMKQSLPALRAGLPRFGFGPFDPWALRSLLLLFIALGVMQAGRDTGPRIYRALHPAIPPVSQFLTDLNVWIKPPAYTGLPPLSLKPGQKDVAMVPENSRLFVQFTGARLQPELLIDGEEQELTALSESSFQGDVILQKATSLKANLGWRSLGQWPVQIVPDAAPQIAWDGEVYATPRAALRIGYKGSDDYGIDSAFAVIEKPGETETVRLKLPSYVRAKQEVRNASYHDVAWHRWAGSEVQIHLEAIDAAGHKTVTAPVTVALPQRNFDHAVAKKIAAVRRDFMNGTVSHADLAAALLDILNDPAAFNYDNKVGIALRVASTRAELSEDKSNDASIADLLWDVALRLEDNGISLAERDLRTLEQALQDAMARGASPEEIENLLDQYEQAMGNYLGAMYQQMQQQGLDDLPPMDSQANAVEANDIDRLMMQVRQLMRSGNHEEAQKLLAKLQEIMANIRTRRGQDSAASKMAQELLKTAQNLVRDQQQLLDRSTGSFAATGPAPAALNAAKKDQSRIAAQLTELQKKLRSLGAPPVESYARAETDMKNLMGQAAPQAATGWVKTRESVLTSEAAALDHLRKGLQELLKNMSGQGGSGQVRAGAGRYDPFGRPRPGQGVLEDPSIKVPPVQELQRAKEILDELQRRSGDYSRPELERDYIKRLLRRF